MKFTLRSTFLLTAVAGALFAISVRRLYIGVFLVSFAPAIFYLLAKRKEKQTVFQLLRRCLIAALLMTPVYVTSIGPYLLFSGLFPIWDPPPPPFTELILPETAEFLYTPLNPLLGSTSMHDQIEWYLDSWSNDGQALYYRFRYTDT